jgi:mRNA-degrading endonuclease RelE of RelBE toxin-antitoxin system
MSYEVVPAESFQACVKQLKKRYQSIAEDLKVAIRSLQADPAIGNVIPNGEGARKLRVRNSSANKGKSGCFRLIYLVQEVPRQRIVLLFVYSKSDQEDVELAELRRLIATSRS